MLGHWVGNRIVRSLGRKINDLCVEIQLELCVEIIFCTELTALMQISGRPPFMRLNVIAFGSSLHFVHTFIVLRLYHHDIKIYLLYICDAALHLLH